MRTVNGLRDVVRAGRGLVMGLGVIGAASGASVAQDNRAQQLPITEVTAFKDGHALIVRSGKVPTNKDGDVVLRDLPQPLLGTFWSDEQEANADLRAVTAARVEVTELKVSTTLPELLMQNIGARIEFKDSSNAQRYGTLRQILSADGPQLALIDETVGGDPSGDRGDHAGTRIAAIPLAEMRDVRFVGASPTSVMTYPVTESRLTLDLEWDGTPADDARVSLMAVEHGLRWIPAYRVTMLGGDRVRIELEATLVNDLADLRDARVHMAVGVPSFAFAGQTDPMALAEHLAQLGRAFPSRQEAGTAGMLSNSIMSQVAFSGRADYSIAAGDPDSASGTTPEGTGGEQAEDLYVFTFEHLSLDEGARMVLPLASYECDAQSVYTLDLIAAPPMQAMQNFNTQQQRELAMRLDRPVARHVLRITNENARNMPITTAPALIIKDGRTLAQGLLRYASAGAKADLEVGAAMDLTVESTEVETGRDPAALTWGSNRFGQINIGFEGCVTNRKSKPITIEITKLALGHSDEVTAGGTGHGVNLLSDTGFWAGSGWGNNYSWPWWWHGVNTATRYRWTLTIEPGESAEFGAAWHYFWN